MAIIGGEAQSIPLIDKKDWVSCLVVKNNDGETVFHKAVKSTKKMSVQVGELLEKLPNEDDKMRCIGIKNNDGDTFLHLATKMAYKDNVIQDVFPLLSSDNKLKCSELVNDKNETILHLAVKYNKANIVDSILQESFKKVSIIGIRDSLGFSPLEWALMTNNDQVIDHILGSHEAVSIFKDINLAILNEDISKIKSIMLSMSLKDRLSYLLKEDGTGHSAIQLAALKGKNIIDAIIKKLSLEDAKEFKKNLESKENQALEKEQMLLIEKIKKMFVIDLPFEMSQVPGGLLYGLAVQIVSLLGYLVVDITALTFGVLLNKVQAAITFRTTLCGPLAKVEYIFATLIFLYGSFYTDIDNMTPTNFFRSTLLGSHLLLTALVASILFSY